MKRFLIGMVTINLLLLILMAAIWVVSSIILWEIQPIIGVNSFAYNNPLRVFVTTEFFMAVVDVAIIIRD